MHTCPICLSNWYCTQSMKMERVFSPWCVEYKADVPWLKIVLVTLCLVEYSVTISDEDRCPGYNQEGCLDCVSKDSSVWCTYGNRCDNIATNCDGDDSDGTRLYIDDPEMCPRISTSSRFIIHTDTITDFALHGHNFPEVKDFKYECQVQFHGGKCVRIDAKWKSNTSVSCDPHRYSSGQDGSGELLGEVILMFGNRETWSKVSGSRNLTVYDCKTLGKDCSTCKSYNAPFRQTKDYNCHWCEDTCQYSGNCTTLCPAPRIYKVFPASTHTRGGVSVTIEGKELGRWWKDVENITLAGQICQQKNESFEVSNRIVCNTQEQGSVSKGPVRVTVRNELAENSNLSFQFGTPQITGIEPHMGPISGGTTLTITGSDLDIGSRINVSLKSGDFEVACTFPENSIRQPDKLFCRTSSIDSPGDTHKVVLQVDGSDFELKKNFAYKANPTVTMIEPRKSFHSGGRVITIVGTNLNVVQAPKFFLRSGPNCSDTKQCDQTTQDTMLFFYSPDVMDVEWKPCGTLGIDSATEVIPGRPKRQTNDYAQNQVTVGFVMDGVKAVQNPPPQTFTITYVTNPVYNNLTEQLEFRPGTRLYISGKNLNTAATMNEVHVAICNSSCNVTSLNQTVLACILPMAPEGCEEEDLSVTVEVGYAEYKIGSLVRVVYVIPIELIVPLAVVVASLIILLIAVTLKLKQHKRKRQRDIKRLQNKYELLERSVRQEVRQEFADLQQDIKLVTSDVVRHGVPYKDLSHYTYAVIFPADIMGENALLNNSQSSGFEETFNETCRKELESLICNKFFLLTCLRVVEMEKKMTAKDKSNLANILTVILLDRLDYMMQIWMVLLKEHVSRAVEKKQQKQIMRRNATIVEKMISNWLALCMYDNMKNQSGSSLYMLYKATEMLTDYGPVDAVTGDAHYTLCEEKLLKDTVPNNPLSITVEMMGQDYPCKVLDCDSISQVKQKCLNQIYASAPVVDRLREDQVDLEWHAGSNGRHILDNFDNTNAAEFDWRRINTLEHYNVKNGAKMVLLSKEDEGIETDSHYANMGSSTSNLLAPGDINVDIDSRIWHLVRTEDGEESPKRVISEIYLTRLMSTKVPLLNYLDHFVETVFNHSHVPMTVKFLFDYFDKLAEDHGLQDPDVCHIWKSNSFPIRYWGNLLRAPQHAFDVHKPDQSEPSLDVLANCFIDSCSLMERQLGKDSPASKLLFNKDVVRYRHQIAAFYEKVKDSTPVSEEEVIEEVAKLSMTLHRNSLFSSHAAVFELAKILKLYECEITEGLHNNAEAEKLELGHKFDLFLEKAMP